MLPIHFVAYYLDPNHITIPLADANIDTKIFECFMEHTQTEEEALDMYNEFHLFRNKMAPFEAIRPAWSATKDPKMFWTMFETHTRFLGKFARRLFSTPANSVSSERAFSIQNIIHTKLRNTLSAEKVDKLTYIYMNARILKSMEGLSLGAMDLSYELSDEQEVAFEDAVMEEDNEEEAEKSEEGEGDLY